MRIYTVADMKAIEEMTSNEAISALKEVQDECLQNWQVVGNVKDRKFSESEYKATKFRKAINLAIKAMVNAEETSGPTPDTVRSWTTRSWQHNDKKEITPQQEMRVPTPFGILHAYQSTDSDYPGIYIDLQRDGYRVEAPLVLIDFTKTEFPENSADTNGTIVCRCWKNINQEDYDPADRTIFTGYDDFFTDAK